MKMFRPTALLLLLLSLVACADALPAPEAEGWSGHAAVGKADGLGGGEFPALLPHPGGQGLLAPWGGPNPAAWQPEAIFANAVSQALNEAWATPGLKDAVVAVPLKLHGSQYFPYGDGQSNAAASFEGWQAPRPPLVATLMQSHLGERVVKMQFDRSLPGVQGQFQVEWTDAQGQAHSQVIQGQARGEGDWVASWVPPQGLRWGSPEAVLQVRPAGWGDGWPLHFYFPAQSVDEMVESVPQELRSFQDGRTIPDPQDVSSQTRQPEEGSAFGRLMRGTAGIQGPFHAEDIHGAYPHRHAQATASGQSWAWVNDAPQAPFKQVYLCMEGRQPLKEAAAGVPTGSGWHKIGDPAEAVLNTLEGAPLLTAWARAQVLPAAQMRGGFAYGLSDVATARMVRPQESFVTVRGQGQQQEYHWFVLHSPEVACVEIWVHPCEPNAARTFDCSPLEEPAKDNEPPEGEVQASFSLGQGHTAFGQNIYLVGNLPQLGGWDPEAALPLTPDAYPTWSASLALEPGQEVEFKFIKRSQGGGVVWESGPNRTWAVPAQGQAAWSGQWRQ